MHGWSDVGHEATGVVGGLYQVLVLADADHLHDIRPVLPIVDALAVVVEKVGVGKPLGDGLIRGEKIIVVRVELHPVKDHLVLLTRRDIAIPAGHPAERIVAGLKFGADPVEVGSLYLRPRK